jgi:hypothetical protein
MARRSTHTKLLPVLALAGCTMVTEARDYEVDPAASVRDLDFTFVRFPHAG